MSSRGVLRASVCLLPALSVVGLALLVAAAAQPTSRPGPGGAPKLQPVRQPISYFNANCSSCHGNYGSFWGDGFAEEYDRKELRAMVEEMAHGPAFAPIEAEALEVQTAYNASLSAGKGGAPFVLAVVKEGDVAGEVTPEASVVVETETGEVKATVEDHTWTAELNGAKVKAVRARLGEKESTVAIEGDGVFWSHRE